MINSKVLYERGFSDFGALQTAHVVRYAVTQDDEEKIPFGISVIRIMPMKQVISERRMICKTEQEALELAGFLWENSIEPESMPCIVDDIYSLNFSHSEV